jgi:23S rRNA pseudouridine2457 synthase
LPISRNKTKQYFLLYKPYGVLSQFSDNRGRKTLKTLGTFPNDVYSVGRLDMDSEGLILLTNDSELNHRLTEPKFEHVRTYLVQIEKLPSNGAIEQLSEGVMIQGEKTKPAEVRFLAAEPDIPPRTPPIRYRKNVPTAWIEITLREGRNRQIRKMTAAVGHPALRLIRTTMGGLSIGVLKPGESRRLEEKEVKKLRFSAGV